MRSSSSGSMEAPDRGSSSSSSSSSDSMEAPARSSSSSDSAKVPGCSSNSSGSMEAPGHSSSGSMEAPRSSGRMPLVGNSSSLGMEAVDTRSSTHIIRNSSTSIRRGQGALVGLATPEVGGISRSPLRLQKRRWGKSTSATGVVLSGVSPGFSEHRTLLRGHAGRVEPTASPPGSAVLPHPPVCMQTLSWPPRMPLRSSGALQQRATTGSLAPTAR